jgi:thiol-disulfide isomerase/thioredoxin
MFALTTLALAFALQAPAPTAPTASTAPTAPTASTASTPAAPAGPSTSFVPVSDAAYKKTVVDPHKGKVVLVNFWASYCLPCLEEIPALRALAAAKKDDLRVVFVSTDEPGSIDHLQKALQKRKLELPSSFIVSNEDPEPFIRMIDDVWQGEMPYTVIYDRSGTPVKKLPGAHSAAEFDAAVVAAMALPNGKKK